MRLNDLFLIIMNGCMQMIFCHKIIKMCMQKVIHMLQLVLAQSQQRIALDLMTYNYISLMSMNLMY